MCLEELQFKFKRKIRTWTGIRNSGGSLEFKLKIMNRKYVKTLAGRLIDWLIVSRFGLVEENAVEVFHHYGVHLLSFSLCKISSHFRKISNVVVSPFLFHIFMPLVNLWFIRLQGYFPILRTRNSPDLYPLIRMIVSYV